MSPATSHEVNTRLGPEGLIQTTKDPNIMQSRIHILGSFSYRCFATGISMKPSEVCLVVRRETLQKISLQTRNTHSIAKPASQFQ